MSMPSEAPCNLKAAVQSHWQRETCGTRGVEADDRRAYFDTIERERYEFEPYIPGFARFERARGKKLLEVGVGAGTDFINWVRHGAIATGVDLTDRAIETSKERLDLEGLHAAVTRADAENLPFEDASFDIVYSYGVLHHSPDTPHAIAEVHRVLRPGGTALIMIYHLVSWVTLMVWGVHCAAKLRPWKSPRWAVYNHLESPGTKAYTIREAHQLFSAFTHADIRPHLSCGDLLNFHRRDAYRRWHHDLAWKLYPRSLIKLAGDRFGMSLLIEATK
jgi:SAM-dependent methyltransferase